MADNENLYGEYDHRAGRTSRERAAALQAAQEQQAFEASPAAAKITALEQRLGKLERASGVVSKDDQTNVIDGDTGKMIVSTRKRGRGIDGEEVVLAVAVNGVAGQVVVYATGQPGILV